MFRAKTGSESNFVTKKLHLIDSHSAACRRLRFKLAEMNLIDFCIYEREEMWFTVVLQLIFCVT